MDDPIDDVVRTAGTADHCRADTRRPELAGLWHPAEGAAYPGRVAETVSPPDHQLDDPERSAEAVAQAMNTTGPAAASGGNHAVSVAVGPDALPFAAHAARPLVRTGGMLGAWGANKVADAQVKRRQRQLDQALTDQMDAAADHRSDETELAAEARAEEEHYERLFDEQERQGKVV